MMIDFALILTYKYQGSQWVLNGDSYDGLVWLSSSTKPTKAELESHWPSLKTYWEDKKAKEQADKNAVLAKLGLTADEAALLLR